MASSDWDDLAGDYVDPAGRCDSHGRVIWLNSAAMSRCGRSEWGSDVLVALAPGVQAGHALAQWRSGVAGRANVTVDLDRADGGWQVRARWPADRWVAAATFSNPAPMHLLDAVPWPMAWIDGGHTCRSVNRAYEASFRRAGDRILGRSLVSLREMKASVLCCRASKGRVAASRWHSSPIGPHYSSASRFFRCLLPR